MMAAYARLGLLAAVAAALLLIVGIAGASAGTTTRVSVKTNGDQVNGNSSNPAIDRNGRVVAFESAASNLVDGDTNGAWDIFVRERDTDADNIFDEVGAVSTVRVSVKTDGSEANGSSYNAAVSSTGRFVAFESAASNLVDGDGNGKRDIFVRDRDTDDDGIFDEVGAVSTTRVSLDTDGNDANGDSYHPSISSTGRYVAFGSAASDLIDGDTNGFEDIFVRDRDTDDDGIFDEPEAVSTIRVSLTNGGLANSNSYHPDITDSGRFVAFESGIHDPDDTNGVDDIYVRDRDTDDDGIFDEPAAVSTIRMSVKTDGTEAHGPSYDPAISSDTGKAVAFRSMAPDLVDGDTNTCTGYPTTGTCPDIFLRDRDTDNDQVFDETDAVSTTRVSISSTGEQGDNASWSAAIGPGGVIVAFDSQASNLVDDDTNDVGDVFVHDPTTGDTSRVSEDSEAIEGNGGSSNPAISVEGRYVAFDSWASNLVLGDTNTKRDIFLHDGFEFPPGRTVYYNVDFRAGSIIIGGEEKCVPSPCVFSGIATVVRGEPYWSVEGKQCADYHIESLTLTGYVGGVEVEVKVGEWLTVPVSSGVICEPLPGPDVTLSLYVEGYEDLGPASSGFTLQTDGNSSCSCCIAPPDCGMEPGKWSSINCTAEVSEVDPDQITYDCGLEYTLCGDCGTADPRVTVGLPQTGGALVFTPVGGIAEWPGATAGPDSLADSSAGSGFNYTALGAALGAAAVALAAGAWLTRRRWVR
jgi:hypothetical protein